ncbi:MAG: SIR2 family protein [Candidatus Saganbacteria bacterium]|nr:SIR2 family protein [Candidatus Saganbacteria bacterium]
MQRIIEALKDNYCIFIGAGIPNHLGFPLWPGFARQMVDYVWDKRKDLKNRHITQSEVIELKKRIDEGQCISSITYCKDLLKENNMLRDYISKIVEIFGNEEKCSSAKNHPVYDELIKLAGNTFIIQTNIDKSIAHYRSTKCFYNTASIDNLTPSTLIYLHGVVTNEQTWILSRDEYDDAYQKNDAFIAFIKKVFERYNVIFLGYSMEDKEILDQIAKVKETNRKYYLILRDLEINRTRNKIIENDLKHYNVKVIRYCTERDGYEEFLPFLKKLNSLIALPIPVDRPSKQDGSELD